jgi:TonB-dependent receptor
LNTPEDEALLNDTRVSDTTAVIDYDEWFPMIHLRVRPTDWCDLRLAYTESVSYPRMDFLVPSKKIKASSLIIELGNPGLKPQLSTNYDAYLSFYSNRIGLLTFGAFYKRITNLIYLRSGHVILDPAKENVDPAYVGYSIARAENNPFDTEVKGLEFEWQTNFKWLPQPFDGIVVSANYTHIWSETKFPRSFVREERLNVFPYRLTSVVDTFRVGAMPDQASDIANFSLGYDLGGFSARVSMALQGKTLTFVGVREELDGFTDTFARWDLSVKYDFTENFGIFYILNNFTNQPDESYMQTARYATAREYYGWTTALGVNIKL